MTSPEPSDQPEPTDPEALAAARAVLPYIESWIEYRAWKLRVPGVQYAIWFDGGVQLSGAVGFANLAAQTPLTTSHLFRIASHSKTFTATAILQLVERGSVRLDDPVSEFVTELADAPSGIGAVTVRELLEHSGGVLRDSLDGDFWQHSRPFPDEAELISLLSDDGVKVERNAGFNYSNMGYSLLGIVIDRASREHYRDYVRAHIIEPLGLENTAADLLPERAGDYAAGHSGFHTSWDRSLIEHVDTGAMSSATGFTSTASDVVRYLAAHRIGSGELLDDASKRMQQRSLWANAEGSDRYYGLGMIIEKVAGRRVIGHSGGYPGHITRSLFDPADGIAISVLTNAIDGPASELSTGVMTLLDAALSRAGKRSMSAQPKPPGDTARFEGRFASVWGVIDIVRVGDRLIATSPSGPDPMAGPDDLEVVDDSTLKIVSGDGYGSIGELIHYEADEAGRVVSIRGGGGMTSWPFEIGDDFSAPWPKLTWR